MILAILLCAAAAPAEPLRADDPGTRVVARHTAGILLGMRVGAAVLWPADYGPRALRAAPANLRVAFTRPPELRRDRSLLESDGDPWTINVIGHGLFGSEIYLRARQCGGGPLAAFLWTAGASVAWEYALEATAKRPSAIDLAWTPIAGGLVLGELRFLAYRSVGGPGALRRIARAVLDPLGSIERAAGAGC